MKILLINGSPKKLGCTSRMLEELKSEFNKNNVDADIFWIGSNVDSCTNCRFCKDNKALCNKHDIVEEFFNIIDNYDGIIIGSPVYYGDITGHLNNFLTRVFYSGCKKLKYMPCAGVTVSRRAGNSLAFSRLNMFFLMHSMIVVGSQYWNECHGDFPNEVELDNEGLQTLRTLARNMIYVIKGLSKEEKPEEPEKHIHTNFISREYLKFLKINEGLYGNQTPPDY